MTAMQLFGYTLAMVLGAITPVILYGLFLRLLDMWKDHCIYRNHKAELAAQRGPYSKVELRRVPNERMLEVVLFDGERIAYRIGVDKP